MGGDTLHLRNPDGRVGGASKFGNPGGRGNASFKNNRVMKQIINVYKKLRKKECRKKLCHTLGVCGFFLK